MKNEDKALPEVYLEILGEERQLKYTLRSVTQFKRLTGRRLMAEGFDTRDGEHIVAMIWCGLIGVDKKLDGDPQGSKVQDILLQIEREVGLEDLKIIGERIRKALQNAGLIDPDSDEGNEKSGGTEKNEKDPSQADQAGIS